MDGLMWFILGVFVGGFTAVLVLAAFVAGSDWNNNKTA